MRSAAANDGLAPNLGGRPHGPNSTTSFRSSAAPHDILHAPDPSEIDTQSDTLRSGRPCDSWTPLEAKVREFLSKMHRWTLSDAGGSAGTELLIRVSLVRSQRGPPTDTGHFHTRRLCSLRFRVQIGSPINASDSTPHDVGSRLLIRGAPTPALLDQRRDPTPQPPCAPCPRRSLASRTIPPTTSTTTFLPTFFNRDVEPAPRLLSEAPFINHAPPIHASASQKGAHR